MTFIRRILRGHQFPKAGRVRLNLGAFGKQLQEVSRLVGSNGQFSLPGLRTPASSQRLTQVVPWRS